MPPEPGALGFDTLEPGALGFDTLELDALELDALELDTLELDALKLDALELDALKLDTLELDASLALGREPRKQHDREGGNLDSNELSWPRQRPKKQIGQEVWMSHRYPPLFMTHDCRRESVIASTGNALHASALQRLHL